MNPKVSIGVPLYNTEKYLRKCLDSVINQTLREIEIIIVNDCSPDDSIIIAKEYQKKDNRIVMVEHDKNLGLGGARNTVIENAKAPYIIMIDSDDWLDLRMLEIMLQKAMYYKADIVACGVKKVYENSYKITDFVKYKNEELIYNCFDSYFRSNRIIPAIYHKLFKLDLFIKNNIRFPLNIYHQDLATTPQIMFYSNNILLIKEQLYFYLQRKGSAVSSITTKHIDSVFFVLKSVKLFLSEHNLYNKYKEHYWNYYFYERIIKFHFLRIANHHSSTEEFINYTFETIKRVINEVDLNEAILYLNPNDIKKIFQNGNQAKLNEANIKEIIMEFLKRIKRVLLNGFSHSKHDIKKLFE
jgi:glycosyltransferase involved in cell wall biosynthesis